MTANGLGLVAGVALKNVRLNCRQIEKQKLNKLQILNNIPMSEQKSNSIPNAEVNSVSHACHKPMLGAGASSYDDVSNVEVLLSAPIDCLPNEYTKGSLIPAKYANSDDEIIEVIICTSISGGANYENNMPKRLTLNRKDFVNGKSYEADYALQSNQPPTLQLALYKASAKTKNMSAFMVGMLGCVEIRETFHGKDAGGIDTCSYVAIFDDGQEIQIENPILVSDLS